MRICRGCGGRKGASSLRIGSLHAALLIFALAAVPAGTPDSPCVDRTEVVDDGDVMRSRGRIFVGRRPIRQIVHGLYARLEGGLLVWLPPVTARSAPRGSQLAVAVGWDVVDLDGLTVSIEGRAVHRVTGKRDDAGVPFEVVGGQFGLRLGPRFGPRRMRRLLASAHVAGGLGRSLRLSPGGTVVLIRAGAGIEYYTRITHFSVGADVSYDLVIGASTASSVGAVAFAKYTF